MSIRIASASRDRMRIVSDNEMALRVALGEVLFVLDIIVGDNGASRCAARASLVGIQGIIDRCKAVHTACGTMHQNGAKGINHALQGDQG